LTPARGGAPAGSIRDDGWWRRARIIVVVNISSSSTTTTIIINNSNDNRTSRASPDHVDCGDALARRNGSLACRTQQVVILAFIILPHLPRRLAAERAQELDPQLREVPLYDNLKILQGGLEHVAHTVNRTAGMEIARDLV
jgi:hypothetical protein